MAYRVEFSKTARRQIERLPFGVRARIERKLQALADDPRPRGVVKMAGTDLGYRLRVGDYRVVYEIEDDILLVLVIGVAHRRDIYRGVP